MSSFGCFTFYTFLFDDLFLVLEYACSIECASMHCSAVGLLGSVFVRYGIICLSHLKKILLKVIPGKSMNAHFYYRDNYSLYQAIVLQYTRGLVQSSVTVSRIEEHKANLVCRVLALVIVRVWIRSWFTPFCILSFGIRVVQWP